jgi:hypothetical protein
MDETPLMRPCGTGRVPIIAPVPVGRLRGLFLSKSKALLSQSVTFNLSADPPSSHSFESEIEWHSNQFGSVAGMNPTFIERSNVIRSNLSGHSQRLNARKLSF